jgi:16S rRNA (guanine527-N7)-methyltransferase
MDQEILNSYSKLNELNVSRETFLDFENYISMILEKNKKINIISQNSSSKMTIINRHIIDSAQIIDFVDFNSNSTRRFRVWRWFSRNCSSNYAKKHEK